MTNPHFNSIDAYRDVESLNAYDYLKNQGYNEQEILEILDQKSRDNPVRQCNGMQQIMQVLQLENLD